MKLSLKGARTSRELSQMDLAKILGVGKTSVSEWERGDKKIKPLHLYAICYVLGYTIDEVEQKNSKGKW